MDDPHNNEKNHSEHNTDTIADAYQILKTGKGLGGSHHSGHGKPIESKREFTHKNHHILIKTSYEIQIDNMSVGGHIFVDDFGHLSCHAFPNYSFSSAVDLIKKIIDKYPIEFESDKKEVHEHGSS